MGMSPFYTPSEEESGAGKWWSCPDWGLLERSEKGLHNDALQEAPQPQDKSSWP